MVDLLTSAPLRDERENLVEYVHTSGENRESSEELQDFERGSKEVPVRGLDVGDVGSIHGDTGGGYREHDGRCKRNGGCSKCGNLFSKAFHKVHGVGSDWVEMTRNPLPLAGFEILAPFLRMPKPKANDFLYSSPR